MRTAVIAACSIVLGLPVAHGAALKTMELRDQCVAVETAAAERGAGRTPPSMVLLQSTACLSYIQGFTSGEFFGQQIIDYRPLWCISSASTLRQLAALFVKRANDNPKEWSGEAYFTLAMALTETFPCSK